MAFSFMPIHRLQEVGWKLKGNFEMEISCQFTSFFAQMTYSPPFVIWDRYWLSIEKKLFFAKHPKLSLTLNHAKKHTHKKEASAGLRAITLRI